MIPKPTMAKLPFRAASSTFSTRVCLSLSLASARAPADTRVPVVGAGVLAMPHAMSQFGMLLGIFVIVFSGLASGFGLYLQARCSKYVARGTASFFALSQLTYPNAAVVFDAAIAIKCFGTYPTACSLHVD